MTLISTWRIGRSLSESRTTPGYKHVALRLELADVGPRRLAEAADEAMYRDLGFGVSDLVFP